MKQSLWDMTCCCLAEFSASFILVFLGCMGTVKTELLSNSHLQVVLGFALAVLIGVQCFACVSGSHITPALTVAAYIYETISLKLAFGYFLSQMLGAFVGYGLLKLVLPSEVFNVGAGFCVTAPHSSINALQGFCIEFVITAIFVMVVCSIWDPRNAKYHDSAPIRVGLSVAALAVSAGPFTGCSMNPARSFAPALWNMNFEYQWIYWIGPLAAAVISAIAYKNIFRREVIEALPPVVKMRQLEEIQH